MRRRIPEKFTLKSGSKINQSKLHKQVFLVCRFERRAHGHDDPFDGEGGTLAHAFFPVYGGDVHFDDDEDWTVDTPRGTSLLMTASHELGHSLGLSHSDVRSALMAPFYRGFEENISLDPDDIAGIQALYGDGESSSRPIRLLKIWGKFFRLLIAVLEMSSRPRFTSQTWLISMW